MIIGYARVSSKTQNLARQVHDLKEFGCEKIFEEKQSGKNFSDRPVYNELRNKLSFDDGVVVHYLSTVRRNKQENNVEFAALMKEEVDIAILNMAILDTRK